MRKFIGAGLAVIMAVALAGCSSVRGTGDGDSAPMNDPNSFTIVTKTLSDGVILECAYITDTNGRAGFECNWEGVNAERELK